MHYEIQVCGSMSEIPASQWNALIGTTLPFLKHQYLSALENNQAVGKEFGWIPQYLTIWDKDKLIGAVPMYLKFNSYGEFVFDWAWADAYARSGLEYYPKLVIATPYNPITGQRLLILADYNITEISNLLINAVNEHSKNLNVSSIHWLFPTEKEMEILRQHKLMHRIGCQFHWTNHDYQNFDDYLDAMTSKNRKKIKRERRRAVEQEITFELLEGDEINDSQWAIYHHFYASTFDKKGGIPTLSLEFFKEIGHTMPDNILVVLAKHDGEYVAGAFNLKDQQCLYGRHWGCIDEFHSLHFETCYYQGLEYCINHKLSGFEPGAQGEHKISRGFLPTITWSAHSIAHPEFKNVIHDFLQREEHGMTHYINSLKAHSPFKELK
jgi:predicted N-acyltransferase